MMLKFFCFGIFFVAYATCKPQPLEVFTEIVNFFETTDVNRHKCDTKTWTDQTNGCLYLSFETEIANGEDKQKLCNEMHAYLNQKNWLEESTANCEVRCNKLKLTLTGKPNPNFDPTAEPQPKPRIESLSTVFNEFNPATLGGSTCYPTITRDGSHIAIDLNCDIDASLNKGYVELCEDIKTYLNQKNMLENLDLNCSPHPQSADKFIYSIAGNGNEM